MFLIRFIKLVSILLILAFLFSPYSSYSKIELLYAQTKNQEELNELRKQKDELQSNVDRLESQRKQVLDEINRENKNQSQLENEIRNLELRILESEFIIQNLELEIEKINLDLEITRREITEIENKIAELEKKIYELTNSLVLYNNLLFKAKFRSTNILNEEKTLQQNLIESEKFKTILKMVEENIKSAQSFKSQVEIERADIIRKKNDLDVLASEKEASTYQLEQQKIALNSQKESKLQQIASSLKKENQLSQKEKEINSEISQYQVQLNAVLNALFLAPPQGTRVAGKQIIGFQGRTGLSCNPISNGVVRTNNYCQKYAGLSDYWYYYDPISYPSYGSHLHFSYFKNDAEIDPWPFVFGDNKSEFEIAPMKDAFLTQPYHPGHRAIDMVAYHGAPVYAVKPGVINYYCDSGWLPADFPDPGYGAIIYHDDGTRTAYWHLQKRADSPRGNCVR